MPTSSDSPFDFQINYDLSTTSVILRRLIREQFTGSDAKWIEDGMATAERTHAGQLRGDGSPYAAHLFRVALLSLSYEKGLAKESVLACLLHDAIEDTDLTEAEIARDFGLVVSDLVLAVTRPRGPDETPDQKRDAKIAHWQKVMGAPRNVRVIKTFDYCDNLISCKFIAQERPAFKKIPRWLMEAKLLYLPLAEKTNLEAARLIESELQYYMIAGYRVGTWLDG